MNSEERRAVSVLAGIYAVRMLGLFMLLPVLSLFASGLKGATPTLSGLAVGAYGITQAGLQIPFGLLSDRIGRIPVIVVGLLIFIAGSAVAALATDIWVLILGRALQGAGAISAAVTALLADRTRDLVRTRAMAVIGISIGATFMLSMMLGPVVAGLAGVSGLFWLAAVLGAGALVLLLTVLPRKGDAPGVMGPRPRLWESLSDPDLVRLYLGVFLLHTLVTALFVAVPFALHDVAGLAVSGHWKVYLPVILISLVGTVPLILVSERQADPRWSVMAGIAILLAAQLLLAFRHDGIWSIALGLVAFFAGFNFLEARLPAWLSQMATPERRGAALGIFASAQFLGAFAGGTLGGWLRGGWGLQGVFSATAVLALIWLGLTATSNRRETADSTQN
jgi:predicted MFS family arabinose efflux permease